MACPRCLQLDTVKNHIKPLKIYSFLKYLLHFSPNMETLDFSSCKSASTLNGTSFIALLNVSNQISLEANIETC